MVAEIVDISDIYLIWRYYTRILRKDPDFELTLELKQEFIKRIQVTKIQSYPEKMIHKLCTEAVINRDGNLIISISRWAELLQNSPVVQEPETGSIPIYNNNYSPRRKRRYVVTDQYSDGAIPYGMVNQPPTGGIAKKDLG
jgi:hypothetical protein